MLEIHIEKGEVYIPNDRRFIEVPPCTLTLEHSLISLAKWEAKWHTPYLNAQKRTMAQEQDYIRGMVIGSVKNEYVF